MVTADILLPSFLPSISYLLRVHVQAEVDEEKEEGKGGGRVLPAHDIGVAGLERPQVGEEGLREGGRKGG